MNEMLLIEEFNNLIQNTEDLIYQFKFKIRNQQEYSNDLFSYLKKFIFNMINQPNLDINSYPGIFEQNKEDHQAEPTKSDEKDDSKQEIKASFIFERNDENNSNKQEKKVQNHLSP